MKSLSCLWTRWRVCLGKVCKSAIAVLFAVGTHSFATCAHAKHVKLDEDAAPEGSTDTASGKSTIIHGELLEVHDRLAPAAYPGIVRLHNFIVTLSGDDHFAETWTDTRNYKTTNQMMRLRRGTTTGTTTRAKEIQVLRDEDSGMFGEIGNNVVWHVIGEKQLQRVFAGKHFILVIGFKIDEHNACRMDAKYLKQTGFEAIEMPRSDTGEMGSFSLPRIMRTSCSIE